MQPVNYLVWLRRPKQHVGSVTDAARVRPVGQPATAGTPDVQSGECLNSHHAGCMHRQQACTARCAGLASPNMDLLRSYESLRKGRSNAGYLSPSTAVSSPLVYQYTPHTQYVC
jgi:hypothetical protein